MDKRLEWIFSEEDTQMACKHMKWCVLMAQHHWPRGDTNQTHNKIPLHTN